MYDSKILFLTFLISITFCFAQFESPTSKFGIFGGINLNSHSADFGKLKNIPNCCPKFESGSGNGFHAGILYERSISNSFWLGAKLGIITLDGELSKDEPTTILLETGPANGKFTHYLTGRFLNFGFEPAIIYNPFGELLFYAGARLGFNLSKNYEQIEKITEPLGAGTFIDSLGNDTFKRTRNEFAGEIPDAQSPTNVYFGKYKL